MKYAIGDTVWRADFSAEASWVTCPDCCGSRRLRVIMGDESVVSIDCVCCERGYEGPTGRLQTYDRLPQPTLGKITEIKLEKDGVKYTGLGFYELSEDKLFLSEAEAKAEAIIWIAALEQKERENLSRKERPDRKWAWNASYHRKEIKEAKRRLEYHTAKLAIAAVKAKEQPHCSEEKSIGAKT